MTPEQYLQRLQAADAAWQRWPYKRLLELDPASDEAQALLDKLTAEQDARAAQTNDGANEGEAHE